MRRDLEIEVRDSPSLAQVFDTYNPDSDSYNPGSKIVDSYIDKVFEEKSLLLNQSPGDSRDALPLHNNGFKKWKVYK